MINTLSNTVRTNFDTIVTWFCGSVLLGLSVPSSSWSILFAVAGGGANVYINKSLMVCFGIVRRTTYSAACDIRYMLLPRSTVSSMSGTTAATPPIPVHTKYSKRSYPEYIFCSNIVIEFKYVPITCNVLCCNDTDGMAQVNVGGASLLLPPPMGIVSNPISQIRVQKLAWFCMIKFEIFGFSNKVHKMSSTKLIICSSKSVNIGNRSCCDGLSADTVPFVAAAVLLSVWDFDAEAIKSSRSSSLLLSEGLVEVVEAVVDVAIDNGLGGLRKFVPFRKSNIL